MNGSTKICLSLLLFIMLLALIGPWISPYSYSEIHLEMKNTPPGWTYWFGSDDLGRDLFCRVWWGARISLGVGCFAIVCDTLIGTLWGALAAMLGGWVEELMMRICDILNAIPTLLIVILLTTLIGTGLKTILLALVLFGWINTARITRAELLRLKESEFALAAKAIGASFWRIVFRHLIPNAVGPILATATLTIPTAIFIEAFLSFLGIGIQAPHASWGIMISDGIGAMEFYPWRLFFPSTVLTATILSFHLIGNGLRDILDPRLQI